MKTPFHGALSLLVFLLTIICTYALAPQGFKLRIPRTRLSVFISFCWIPWLAATLLLVFQAVTFADVGTALRGDGSLRPYSIIVTYLSLAYLAISCEITGLFSWLSLHVASWARGRPVLLLPFFFGLSGALAAVTSPDVSLVTLTPIIIYAAGAANLDPMALAATHMSAASVWGMLVPVAGPVNILISHAFHPTFMHFLGWLALPTSAAAVAVFGLLYVLLQRQRLVSTRNDAEAGALPYPDPGVMLHDQVGAACSSALLVGCLLALAVGPWLRWSGWLVAAVFALVAALYNLAASSGPLQTAIGRRSAYERRRRLQAELAQQGLYRVVTDEDLADLLLSAAQDRQASFTRLAAATASRVTASTPALALTVPPLSASFGAPTSAQRRAANGSSSSNWGFAGIGARLSSCSLERSGGGSSGQGLGLGQGLPSIASLSGSGGGGGGVGLAGSPVRHWFSRRWSSFRGFSMPSGAATELVEAAAAAGADRSILRECGIVSPPAATRCDVSADGADATSITATGAVAERLAVMKEELGDDTGTFWTRHSIGVSRTATTSTGGEGGSGGGGGNGPGLPRVSSELHHLLTHGTSTAPDSLEWWAAAALAAQELLGTRGDLSVGTATTATSAPLYLPSQMAKDDMQSGSVEQDINIGVNNACGDSAGSGGAGRLIAASPFASPAAMSFPGWDGQLHSAAACGNGAADVEAATAHNWLEEGGESGSAARTASSHPRQHPHDTFHHTGGKHQVGTASHVDERDPGLDSSRDTYVAVDSGGGCGCNIGDGSAGAGGDGDGGGDAGGGHGGVRWKSVHATAAPVVPRAVVSEGGGHNTTADIGSSSNHYGDHHGGGSSPSTAAAPVSPCLPVLPMWYVNLRPLASPIQDFGRPLSALRQQSIQEVARALPTSADHSMSSSPQRCMPRPPCPHQCPYVPQHHSFYAGPGKRDSDLACRSASAALFPPVPLDLGTISLEAWPSTATRPSLPVSGLGSGLFKYWRRHTTDRNDAASESVALLPSHAAASDDPGFQAQAPLLPTPSPRLLFHAEKPLALTAESTSTPGGLQHALHKSFPSVYDPHGNGCAHGFADGLFSSLSPSVGGIGDGGVVGGAKGCHTVTGQHGQTGPTTCRRSPFAALNTNVESMRQRAASDENGAAADCGCGMVSCGSSFLPVGGNTPSRNHYMLRRPSVALLLLGSNEVSFLGTFLALPWANTVFLLGWFVLVETMQVHGWLDALARFLTAIIDSNSLLHRSDYPLQGDDPSTVTFGIGALSTGSNSSSSPTSSSRSAGAFACVVFAVGWLATLMSIGMTGQSAALLLARVMMRPDFLAALQQTATPEGAHAVASSAAVAGDRDAAHFTGGAAGSGGAVGGEGAVPGLLTATGAVSAAHRSAQLALVVAANLAPALSLSGSLTALRWGLRLEDLGVRMRCCKYMFSALAPAALAGTALALLVLWAQSVAWQQF